MERIFAKYEIKLIFNDFNYIKIEINVKQNDFLQNHDFYEIIQ